MPKEGKCAYLSCHFEVEATSNAELAADIDPVVTAQLMIALMDGLQTQWLLDESVDMVGIFEEFLRRYFGDAIGAPDGVDRPTNARAGNSAGSTSRVKKRAAATTNRPPRKSTPTDRSIS